MYLNASRRIFRKAALLLVARIGLALAISAMPGRSAGADAPADRTSDAAVYEPGGDVKAPKLIHYVEPNFSSSSKEAFVEGTVRISAVVGTDGLPGTLKVLTGLNAEEDQRAVDAVTQWRFAPGTKKGEPVKVRVTVEVDFHLL